MVIEPLPTEPPKLWEANFVVKWHSPDRTIGFTPEGVELSGPKTLNPWRSVVGTRIGEPFLVREMDLIAGIFAGIASPYGEPKTNCAHFLSPLERILAKREGSSPVQSGRRVASLGGDAVIAEVCTTDTESQSPIHLRFAPCLCVSVVPALVDGPTRRRSETRRYSHSSGSVRLPSIIVRSSFPVGRGKQDLKE